MKPTAAILTLIAVATSASLHASSWNFTEAAALADWTTMGRVQQSADGLEMGPSDGPYAISGIKSNEPAAPSSLLTLKVSLDALSVSVPAPDDAENENDIRINIVLNPTSTGAWESEKAVINVALFLNSRHGGLYVGLYGKGEGFPNQGAELLTGGAFLGEGSGSGTIGVEISVDEKQITAKFSRGEEVLKVLEAPLSDNLRGLLTTPLYTVIYQQNIQKGSGSFILQNVSRE
jgi:hypothetical protein